MASFAFIDCRVEINSVVLSAFARSATLKVEAAELDDTAFGDTFHSRIGGLKDWSVDIEFNSDFAASAVDATLWPLLGTTTTVKIRATSAAISSTNPEYSGTVLVKEVNPMGNSVGDLATVSVSWPGAGTLSRATA
ncbi:radical SAM protein [Nonomuraea typhae]|uniref:radical SAM protein n=1 Tax=Nonomuraea typhae TaxID=2603600 RepID=UPI0012FB6B2B|nr:radical SAM protein [Nonomuraea typhae]